MGSPGRPPRLSHSFLSPGCWRLANNQLKELSVYLTNIWFSQSFRQVIKSRACVRLCFADGTSPRDWQLFVTEYSDFYWATPCATVRSDMSHVQMSCDSPSAGRYVTVLNTQGPLTVCEIQTHGQCTRVIQLPVCHS